MTKIFEIVNNRVHHEYPEYDSVEQAYQFFSKDILFVEAPDTVWVGYGYDPTKTGDDRFIRPALNEGWEYDENGLPWNPEEQRSTEREQKHAETTNDTLQALRKIREGDKEIDWGAWLDALDEYNRAIEDTVNQKEYPNKISYPAYPTKPTK